MPYTTYQAGATSKMITMRAWVISTGLPYTAGAYNTSGLTVKYCRDGATVQTITQVTATAGTYTSSGFVHRGDGVYEIGAPTAALAAGADGVTFTCAGITDVVFEAVRVELVGVDPRSSAPADVNVATINAQTVVASGGITFPAATLASTTNITAGTITTVTNLTNAPTAGDLTATMKTSVTTAASAATPSVTVSDKTGFSLSTAGILAIWHQLTSAVVTASTMGKLILDFLDAAVSSRLATSGYTAPLTAATTRSALGLASANLDTQLDALPTAAEVATQITSDHGAGSYVRNTEPLDAAGTRTALGLASANLDTQLDALPTNAELATALGTADDAVLAAIAALNNLSSAGAQAAAAAALAAYQAATVGDIPTASANAAAVLSAATATPVAANVKEINDVTLTGTGVLGDEWGP